MSQQFVILENCNESLCKLNGGPLPLKRQLERCCVVTWLIGLTRLLELGVFCNEAVEALQCFVEASKIHVLHRGINTTNVYQVVDIVSIAFRALLALLTIPLHESWQINVTAACSTTLISLANMFGDARFSQDAEERRKAVAPGCSDEAWPFFRRAVKSGFSGWRMYP